MKVRVGSIYTWVACMLDTLHPSVTRIPDGTKVRVVNMKGCPPANTMNHCYAETIDGVWLGLVCCSSLYKAADAPAAFQAKQELRDSVQRIVDEGLVHAECK